jgi:hypothetical protein
LGSTESGWHRAFEGQEPTRAELALIVAGSDPERNVAIPFGVCEGCNVPLAPPTKPGSPRRYCSERCRQTVKRAAGGVAEDSRLRL